MITDAYLDLAVYEERLYLTWEGLQLNIPIDGNRLLHYWGDRAWVEVVSSDAGRVAELMPPVTMQIDPSYEGNPEQDYS
jgi:hypothetical protein